jgi:hypothetical protein
MTGVEEVLEHRQGHSDQWLVADSVECVWQEEGEHVVSSDRHDGLAFECRALCDDRGGIAEKLDRVARREGISSWRHIAL